MRSISFGVWFSLSDKGGPRLPHDFGHVSESVECILFVFYHVAWRDQQMSWKPKTFRAISQAAAAGGEGGEGGGAGGQGHRGVAI